MYYSVSKMFLDQSSQYKQAASSCKIIFQFLWPLIRVVPKLWVTAVYNVHAVTQLVLSIYLLMYCKDTILKIRNKCSQKRNCTASVPISTVMCVWGIYIFPRSGCLFCWRKICGSILGIYKSITDTWMWKLGLRPHNPFSRNTYMGFLLQCGEVR